MVQKGRSHIDETLAFALACGATVAQAAVRSGVAERTVYRRLEKPAFRQRIADHRREMVERTAALLTAAAAEAVRTLLGLQKDGVKSNVRLGAARAILDLGFRARELAELEQELRELEQKVEALNRDAASGHGSKRR